VRSFYGHGVGRAMHEDPTVPNYVTPEAARVTLRPGMTFAAEPMINAGTAKVVTLADQWTVVTADRRPSVHFEHTVAVTADGVSILTRQ
jgi:methionyl aminopeptidase